MIIISNMSGQPSKDSLRPAPTEAGPPAAKSPLDLSGRSPAEAVAAAGRLISSRELMGSAKEILIEHHGEIYRLRATRSGKLILNK